MKKLVIIAVLCSVIAPPRAMADTDYTAGDGFFIVNEDWYGHQNSTVNYIRPDASDGEYWEYRVFQTNNPGKELGCTNQYGAVWNGDFFLIAKQEQDPGANIKGGRITVADAKTMKVRMQCDEIGLDGARADGRGFCGVSARKGYVSTSDGIWVFDIRRLRVVRKIPGTENPNGADSKPNYDPTGSLYVGQCGSMVLSGNYVFAAHQAYGLLAIDTDRDETVKVISMDMVAEGAGIGSVVKAKDGSIWCSVAKDIQGLGDTLPYLVRVDPKTLAAEVVSLPDGIYAPANSWYAWTPDGFHASEYENVLFWNGGENSWFSSEKIFRFDVDSRSATLWYDLSKQPGNWNIYGCSMRTDPASGHMYISLTHGFSDNNYVLRRLDSTGAFVKDYPMIANYWFPSLPVFPASASTSGIDDMDAVVGDNVGSVGYYDLYGRYCGDSPEGLRGIYIRKSGARAEKIMLR